MDIALVAADIPYELKKDLSEALGNTAMTVAIVERLYKQMQHIKSQPCDACE